jgi:hypothetical protein
MKSYTSGDEQKAKEIMKNEKISKRVVNKICLQVH